MSWTVFSKRLARELGNSHDRKVMLVDPMQKELGSLIVSFGERRRSLH
jgi:hypothetical protein